MALTFQTWQNPALTVTLLPLTCRDLKLNSTHSSFAVCMLISMMDPAVQLLFIMFPAKAFYMMSFPEKTNMDVLSLCYLQAAFPSSVLLIPLDELFVASNLFHKIHPLC